MLIIVSSTFTYVYVHYLIRAILLHLVRPPAILNALNVTMSLCIVDTLCTYVIGGVKSYTYVNLNCSCVCCFCFLKQSLFVSSLTSCFNNLRIYAPLQSRTQVSKLYEQPKRATLCSIKKFHMVPFTV